MNRKQIWKCSENHETIIGFASEGEPNAYAIPCKHRKCKHVAYPTDKVAGPTPATYEWYLPEDYESNTQLLSEEQLQDVRKGLLLLRRVEQPRLNKIR